MLDLIKRKTPVAKVHVTAKRDFIESLVTTRPILALSEMIWNGFDADSQHVKIAIDSNAMHGVEAIRIKDQGYGIDANRISAFFGDLGESWKKQKYKQNGRALHGKNGKGRFKAFSLGERVEWVTTFERSGKKFSYKIVGHVNTIDDFEVSEPVEVAASTTTGTEVIISNIRLDFKSLRDGSAPAELSKIYAAYLTDYPHLSLFFNGAVVDPKSAQVEVSDYKLKSVLSVTGERHSVHLSVIEWNTETERVLHLCDPNGVSLHSMQMGPQVRAPGFHFTAYIKSALFRDLDKSNALILAELHPEVQGVLVNARAKLKNHFRMRLAQNQSEIVAGWRKEEIYPFDSRTDLAPVELAERQMFDILAVNVQSYLPSFELADHKSRKFTFLLLAQAIRQNPESVQLIISEVLGLKSSEQDQLAELLGKTSLSSIISSAEIVANRLDFLMALEALLFDKESKKKLLERDQLHKILEQEAWIFDEEFSLSGSEERLEDVLTKHLGVLGNREDKDDVVDLGEGKTGRIDLMLQKVVQPRSGEYDYLVVELKRPSKKVDSDVLIQIEKYAIAVANDERFSKVPAKWKFIAVSNELDDFALRKANQRDRPKGQTFDDSDLKITVWAKSWSEVINDARAKLDFLNKQLAYAANRESAKKYLEKAHAKFIPNVSTVVEDDDDSPPGEPEDRGAVENESDVS